MIRWLRVRLRARRLAVLREARLAREEREEQARLWRELWDLYIYAPTYTEARRCLADIMAAQARGAIRPPAR